MSILLLAILHVRTSTRLRDLLDRDRNPSFDRVEYDYRRRQPDSSAAALQTQADRSKLPIHNPPAPSELSRRGNNLSPMNRPTPPSRVRQRGTLARNKTNHQMATQHLISFCTALSACHASPSAGFQAGGSPVGPHRAATGILPCTIRLHDPQHRFPSPQQPAYRVCHTHQNTPPQRAGRLYTTCPATHPRLRPGGEEVNKSIASRQLPSTK